MLSLDRVPVDVSMETYDCCCTSFFTETIPQCFENTWNAVAEWIDASVLPFFESCRVWFEENAVWLWPVAVIFVGITAIGLGIAFACFVPTSPLPKETHEPHFESNTPSDDEETDSHSSHHHDGHYHKSGEEAHICALREQIRSPIPAMYCFPPVDPATSKKAIATLFSRKQPSSNPSEEEKEKLKKLQTLINQLDEVEESLETPPSTSSEAQDLIQKLEEEVRQRYYDLDQVTPDDERYERAMEQKKQIYDFVF